MDKIRKSKLNRVNTALLILIDIILINLSALAAIVLRVEFIIADAMILGFFDTLLVCLVPCTAITLFVFRSFRLYSSRWEYAGEKELMYIGFAAVCSAAFYYTIALILKQSLPRSFPFLFAMLLFVCVAVSRFAFRRS
ncbi:MAG: hypothetical protein IJE09_00780, partial [Oscillospiraceae bacterium]|nr:hypothetical protein [Oscillospiraceae bacterium]